MLDIIQSFDTGLLVYINTKMASAGLDIFMKFISGSVVWLAIVSVWVIRMIHRRDRSSLRSLIVCLALVGVSDVTSSQILKPWIGRFRPCKTMDNIRVIDGCAGRFGLPSNHAANSMTAAIVCLRLCRPFLGLLMGLLAILVAFSRVYLGVHYPTDVSVGLIYGFLVACLGLWIIGKFFANGSSIVAQKYQKES